MGSNISGRSLTGSHFFDPKKSAQSYCQCQSCASPSSEAWIRRSWPLAMFVTSKLSNPSSAWLNYLLSRRSHAYCKAEGVGWEAKKVVEKSRGRKKAWDSCWCRCCCCCSVRSREPNCDRLGSSALHRTETTTQHYRLFWTHCSTKV